MEDLMPELNAFGVPISVLVAVAGYIISHQLQLRAQRMQTRLEARYAFVSAQLERLYGPLYAMVEANTAAWTVFRQSFRPGQPLDYATYDEHERAIWRTWAENVFVPSNLRMREIIEEHAHLLIEGELPPILVRLIAHIEASKLVIPLMDKEEDMRTIEQFEPWPQELRTYVHERYRQVAQEHATLTGRMQYKAPRPTAD